MPVRPNIHEQSLQTPPVIQSGLEKYALEKRVFQGIPGLELSPDGKFFATWYANNTMANNIGEGPGNYVLLAESCDGGKSWVEPVMVIAPEGKLRAFDPCLWTDPTGKLWLFWAQSYQWFNGVAGVWAMRCDKPDSCNRLEWTNPMRIADGVMINKPTVTASGKWLLPVSLWNYKGVTMLPELEQYQKSSVVISADQGESWQWTGGVRVPGVSFDEHMLIERRDGSIWMVIRTNYGFAQSISRDQCKSWSDAMPMAISSPNSRCFLRRLQSGNLILVWNNHNSKRCNMSAAISEDDGFSWSEPLMLDEREDVSYPDGIQDNNGNIHIIYDRKRTSDMEILTASFNEADIRAGKPVSPSSKLRQVISGK